MNDALSPIAETRFRGILKVLMSDMHQQIADLEDEIENLSEAAERCRKTLLVAKATAAVGGIVVLIVLMGLLRLHSMALIFGIAAALGGVALYGSNRSTLDELTDRIREREARRAGLIDALELHTVEDG